MIRWILAALLWVSAANAQVVSIPGAQISGAPLQNHIATWGNPTTIQDSGVGISGLTLGVTSVGITTSAPTIFGTANTVTTAGSVSFGLLAQPANTVLAGPLSGASAVPTFRSITGADFFTVSQGLFFSGPITGSATSPVFRSISNADLPNPSLSAIGGIRAIAKTANQWIDALSTSGIPNQSQPSFSDLSGTLSPSQFPVLTGSVFNSLGSVTVTITNSAITTSMLQNAVVTNAKLDNMSGGTFKGTQTTGAPQDLTASTILKTIGNTQGQILFNNGTDWVPLSPGTSGSVFTTQGTNQNPLWVVVQSSTLSSAVITSTLSWSKPSTIAAGTFVKITVYGGGGGGGSGQGGATTSGGGGGGGGATCINWKLGSAIGSTVAATIGGGGGTSSNGSSSSFGTFCTAGGGFGGSTGGASAGGTGGAGGTSSGGTVNITGMAGITSGASGGTVATEGGPGGGTTLGSGGLGGAPTGGSAGTVGNVFGGGGGGGGGSGPGIGASGASGGIVLEWIQSQ